VTWLPEGGPSEDLAVFKQQRGAPPQEGNGWSENNHNGSASFNGNGPANFNGNGNGNGSRNHNGLGDNNHRKVDVSLSEEERERLKAEVVYWGLQQSQQGRMLSEEQLQEEYDRRLNSAEQLLYSLQANVQQEYDRVRAAEQLRREREERERARFTAPQPQGMPQPGLAPEPDHWTPKPIVSRRNALKLIGLLGLQGAAAFGSYKLATNSAAADAAAAANNGVPAGVLAAGATANVDGSDDANPLDIDQVKLAANFNQGKSLYAPFPGAVAKPEKARLDLLYPPPPLPAQPGRVKEFTLNVQEKVIDIAKGVKWFGWTYNGTIPGPVIRVTQGDTVKITLNNGGKHPHSVHFHSIHPGNMDGVFQIIPAGGTGTYQFTAEPFGVFPYHCHIEPLDQHVARGLYGMLIIDPPKPRPAATELTMVMNGFDTNFDKQNELYSINGLPMYYHDNPIPLKVGEFVRVYLVNMTEFDAVNSFHLHANMYNYIPLGTSLTPSFLTDVVHLGIADRGILEFKYKYPGQFLFHAHQNELTLHGWNAMFSVTA
jgi:FtsP/CotA-like multicopper oxidase with cupredoxin domain